MSSHLSPPAMTNSDVPIAQFLEALIAQTLSNSITSNTSQCSQEDQTLVNCLANIAKVDKTAARQCILCPIAKTENSKATTCGGFVKEGFCEDCKLCEETDCPTACWPEFDEWMKCKEVMIGCPGMCQGDERHEWWVEELEWDSLSEVRMIA
mmetsp:Transcript_26904/g.57931  ORF Transcript_26904/g.57931 Transcript_26904/m.57931 type:complete len:152 (-) Transcript_26904:139-594(-)|eukprot:CAMPEP_0196153080 /NCGR_PEP_ID=MMETSP0910-20130528/36575_1 /TAXON_ID=49265 /ORGANISM="Thalassiosira rotula, Strain GSO102" /LENGTH=151 /DNA_ID=CAMNT_0041416811 /DNA_START=232 /DNA_END=687 /DNA_ORIENTATION=+